MKNMDRTSCKQVQIEEGCQKGGGVFGKECIKKFFPLKKAGKGRSNPNTQGGGLVERGTWGGSNRGGETR